MQRGWIALAALVVAAAGCERGGAKPADPRRLDGEWSLELRLEHPVRLLQDPATAAPLRGEVVLLENGRVRRAGRLSGPPSHYGSHTLDPRAFGIDLRAGGHVPTAAARLARPDSLELVLDPEAHGGGITLAGRLAGDSAAGRWWYASGRTVGASGRFVLRRERP